jgi:copper chaperone NosL
MYKYLCLLFLVVFACKPKESPIQYGQDECHYCKMMIMENQYGTELVTKKSKTYKFDSVECLIDFVAKGNVKEQDAAFILITSFDDPGKLKEARSSYFLHSKQLPSPMGMYLTAFDSKAGAEKAQEEYGGDIYNWETLNRKFNSLK